MTDKTILELAAEICDGDRERVYGSPGKNLAAIANLWDSWLLARGFSGPGIRIEDVACMMTLLKLARLANDPTHQDSRVDAVAYLYLIEKIERHQAKADSPKHQIA